jgi:hypothetical protein
MSEKVYSTLDRAVIYCQKCTGIVYHFLNKNHLSKCTYVTLNYVLHDVFSVRGHPAGPVPLCGATGIEGIHIAGTPCRPRPLRRALGTQWHSVLK